MKRVVILGRGASGKSTLAKRLGELTGLPVIELDKVFWRSDLVATPRNEWIEAQKLLVAKENWIMDGDLGQSDVVEVRLRAAEVIILLDYSLGRCAWRAIWRSRERADFWWWVLMYRRQSLPVLMKAIAKHAPNKELRVFRSPASLKRFVDHLARST